MREIGQLAGRPVASQGAAGLSADGGSAGKEKGGHSHGPPALDIAPDRRAMLGVLETAFRVAGTFDAALGTKAWISWRSDPEGTPLGTLRIEVWIDRAGRRAIHVPPQSLNLAGTCAHSPGQTVRLAVTRPHLGGERFWFICECGRRVRAAIPAPRTDDFPVPPVLRVNVPKRTGAQHRGGERTGVITFKGYCGGILASVEWPN